MPEFSEFSVQIPTSWITFAAAGTGAIFFTTFIVTSVRKMLVRRGEIKMSLDKLEQQQKQNKKREQEEKFKELLKIVPEDWRNLVDAVLEMTWYQGKVDLVVAYTKLDRCLSPLPPAVMRWFMDQVMADSTNTTSSCEDERKRFHRVSEYLASYGASYNRGENS